MLTLSYIHFQDRNTATDSHHHVQEIPSPFTDEQIMKDEMVDNASHSPDGSAKDGDASNGCTWVIPLEQDQNAKPVVATATEDTKF